LIKNYTLRARVAWPEIVENDLTTGHSFAAMSNTLVIYKTQVLVLHELRVFGELCVADAGIKPGDRMDKPYIDL